MSVNSSTSRSSSWVRVMPTATSATTGAPMLVSEAELGPKTGTIARIDGPSVPTYSSVKTSPSGAPPRLPMKALPSCSSLGCDQRVRSRSITTTKSTPGVDAHRLGVGLEQRGRVAGRHRLADHGRARHRPRDRHRLVAGAGPDVVARVVRREGERRDDQDQHHDELQDQHLARHGLLVARSRQHRHIVGPVVTPLTRSATGHGSIPMPGVRDQARSWPALIVGHRWPPGRASTRLSYGAGSKVGSRKQPLP